MNFNNYPLYLITSKPYDKTLFLKLLRSALEKGVRLVQIRAKELNNEDYKKLSMAAIELCHEYDAKVLLSIKLDCMDELNADGVHLPSADMMNFNTRPIPNKYILSVACHNAEQVVHATTIDADLVIICPIFSTPSSPQGNPMGWSTFSTLSRLTTIPVYALGGVSPSDLDTARLHGATGIAAIRSLWIDDIELDQFTSFATTSLL